MGELEGKKTKRKKEEEGDDCGEVCPQECSTYRFVFGTTGGDLRLGDEVMQCVDAPLPARRNDPSNERVCWKLGAPKVRSRGSRVHKL